MSQSRSTFAAGSGLVHCARSVPKRLGTTASMLWDRTLGRRMTLRLERAILPTLRWNQEVYGAWLTECVNGTTRWLDAGCGHRLLPPDFERLERALVQKAKLAVGVDTDERSLGEHKALSWRICGSLDSLPFASGAFDLISCNMVVEHLPDPARTFCEFGRVLRPGGLLLVHTPNTWNYAVCVARVLKKVFPRRLLLELINWSEERRTEDIFPTFYRANSRTAIQRQLSDFGFEHQRLEMLVGPQPVCRIFAPIAFCELLVMRASMWKAFRPFATTMLCSFRKGAVPSRAGCY
jgi:SAM-dependent methyltransferase